MTVIFLRQLTWLTPPGQVWGIPGAKNFSVDLFCQGFTVETSIANLVLHSFCAVYYGFTVADGDAGLFLVSVHSSLSKPLEAKYA